MIQFEEIYTDKNRRQVLRVCHRILRNVEDAEDAAQNAFLKAFRELGRFRGESSVSTWLCTIARNQAIDYLRSQPRVEFVSLNTSADSESPFTFGDLLPADDPSPEWYVFLSEAMEAVDRLFPSLRVPLQLQLQGYTLEEIGAAMGMLSVMCIKTRLLRAKQEMRRRIG